jgi:hypothetical protein
MAILKFSTKQHEDGRISRVHFLALVLIMKKVRGSVTYGPYVDLQYNYEGSQDQYLDLDIINFSAFHMPACVLQSPRLNIHATESQKHASAFKSHVFFTKFQVQGLLV